MRKEKQNDTHGNVVKELCVNTKKMRDVLIDSLERE